MEQVEIDEQLRRYIAAQERIAANLVELDDHATYSLLTSDTLTGATASDLGSAIDAAPRMWTLLESLRRHLELAESTRGIGRLNTERRTQLVHLLQGASLVVETVETPLVERDLLQSAAADRRVTVEAVIDELRSLYTPLRDGVARIDQVWRDILPRLDAADTTLRELKAELVDVDASEPLVAMGLRRVEELRTSVMDDPLGVAPDAGVDLDTLVAEAAFHVGELRESHAELAIDLARSESLVAQARTLRSRAATAYAEAQVKIKDPSGLARAPAAGFIDELGRQAAELRRSTGPWQHTRQWLNQWIDRAERLVAQLTRVEAANRAPLARRSQLRGLLTAYSAKAAQVGRIEDRNVIDLIDEAENELYTSPTDLDRAAVMVGRLAQAISEPGRDLPL